MTQAIKEVRLNSLVPTINKETQRIESVHVIESVFKLGVGPCGKTVERLDVLKLYGALSIIQYCSDGEAKEFLYMDKDIVGRPQVLHREGRPNDQTTGAGDGSRN